jgi:TonB family protein
LNLNLLRDWREPVTTQRVMRAVVGSVAFHTAVFGLFWIAPAFEPYRVPPGTNPDLRKSVLLVVPRDLLQGTVPSPGSSAGHQSESAAAKQQPAPRFRPPSLSPGPPAVAPAPMIQAPSPDTPADTIVPPPSVAGTGAPAPLPIPAQRPKTTFEAVGGPPTPSSGAKQPSSSAEDALRAALRSGGGVRIPSDTSEDTSGLPELRSDPKGVDFTQYLVQVRTKVKRNWLLVIPDAARRGRRGVVQVDFAIDRSGVAHAVKIAVPSGVQSFDLAAVAGITASYPFPPLPPEYKGDQIELRMTFTYTQR